MAKTAIESAKVEAAWNGSAKDKVLTRQTDQMVLAYKQQAELAATETQFGKASLQVDQLRNVQAREMLDVRLAEQGILAGSANWHRIMAALAAQELATATQIGDEKRRQVDAVALGYRQEAALSAAGRQFGQDSFQVERIRARQAKEALDLRLEEMGVIKGSVGWQKAHNALLDQQLQRELDIVAAKKEAVRDQLDRLNGIRREIALIGASNAEQARANALAEADIEIRKRKLTGLEAVLERIRAIARANAETERDRQKALADIANQSAGDGYDAQIAAEPNPILRATLAAEKEYARQIADGADASVAAASAERVRARAMQELTQSQQDYLRDQATRLQQMQLELALIGQTAAVRARVLALVQAERDIQRLGATGDIAQTMRRNAVLEAEGTQFIERQADAWKRVQSAGESAIDSVLDKLKAGDVGGAIADLIGEIEKGFFDLAVRNPLKNALFGGNLGTLDDLGGLSGIFDRLTGKKGVDEAALVSTATAAVQSMAVNAANVTIGGIGLQSFLSQGGAAGGAAGFGAGSLGGSTGVQSQVWSFFAGKGLKPHQIAGIMGNVSAESAFNPLARGDPRNGSPTSFGLFQHHGVRAEGLLGAVGGEAGLGNIGAQLEHVWKELLSSENGVLKKLLASTDVQQSTSAFAGFERPQGWTAANPEAAHNFTGRMSAANAALAQFGNTATTATTDLGTLGEGMGGFGKALSSGLQGLASGGTQGGLSGFFGTIAGSIAKTMGLPGFSSGGETGGSSPDEVRGFVHGKEFVFDAAATARIGVANLENLRRGTVKGYASGGYVGADQILTSNTPSFQAANQSAAPATVSMSFAINDYSGQKVEATQGTDGRGQPQITMTIGQQAAAAVSQRGNPLRRAMQSEFSLSPAVRQRG
ncbi:phage tail tip lysozyme [Pseudorhodobacter sp.]|uniref:phage tail tip lysozyme n=2 Tax=Pseudorhodobacter sp. TaxID=1934400 RepID=UPI002AFE525D|nr:phage tail tip lysozyme [Pseudorhodobacter sp.]